MIELDVQLSRDKIPIIHHDFSTKVFLREVKHIFSSNLTFNKFIHLSRKLIVDFK